MAPFGRLSPTSYSTSIVTICLRFTVLKIYPFVNTRPNGEHRSQVKMSNHEIMIGTCFLRRGDQGLVEYTEVLAKFRFFLIQVQNLTTLRSRDIAIIGHIA